MHSGPSCTAAKYMVQRTLGPIFRPSFRLTLEKFGCGKRLIMFLSIVRVFQAWKRYGAVTRELSHLSDRELSDIGITRSDIDRIASDYAHR